MSEINVISRTQKIVVEPYSRSVAVINTGPQGPGGTGAPGTPGEKGDPGEPGGSLLSAFWQYATATTTPPGGGQIRTPSPITHLWVSEIDTDGFNRAMGLSTVGDDSQILVRAANGTGVNLQITGVPVDNGTWWTFPVSVIVGSVTKGTRTQLNFIQPTEVTFPPGGATGDVLTKLSPTDSHVGWAPVPGPPNTDEPGTSPSPTPGDVGTMKRLSSSSAITVTLPSNSTTAIAVNSEFHYVWWGTGQPTFAEGSGATVVGTPGLKLRARYSACTAKKMATDTWLVYGDLSA